MSFRRKIMERKKLQNAEKALRQISLREGKTVNEVKNEIKKAMLIGLCSQDTKVQEYWRRIPCEGDIPTPEEVIVFLAYEAKKKL
jgi:cell division protein YceG involved in septum cleavage